MGLFALLSTLMFAAAQDNPSSATEEKIERQRPFVGVARIYRKSALQRLPLGRSPTDAVALTPGVVRSPQGLHISGSAPNEVEWRLDGMNVTDPVMGGLGRVPAATRLVPGTTLPLPR